MPGSGRQPGDPLRAGQAYPDDVKQLYLQVPPGAIGPEATKLLDEIVAAAPSKNPYDLAATMESRLKRFTYNQNVVGRCPAGMSVVECFATIREGYCQYYASTMVILLRKEGIPARLVQGFLPGALPSRRIDEPGTEPGTATITPRGAAGGPGLLIAVAVVLLLAVAGLAFIVWQRGPRGEVSADSAWRGIARTAARFGFGPRPTQTVYEYAGSLGEVLPTARPALETVARAKVEVAYGRRQLAPDALATLREAQRRVRLNLLRLVFRREERRRRKRRGI